MDMGSTFTGIKESGNVNESQTERTIMESGFGLEQLVFRPKRRSGHSIFNFGDTKFTSATLCNAWFAILILRSVKTHCESKIAVVSTVITSVGNSLVLNIIIAAMVIVFMREFPFSYNYDCHAYDLVRMVTV